MGIFSAIKRETSAGGVVAWTTTGYCGRTQENHKNRQEESNTVVTSEPYTLLRKKQGLINCWWVLPIFVDLVLS